MTIDYLIEIDVEATCFPTPNQTMDNWFAEIIDFGAILINLETSVVERHFQSYVKPTRFPYLTNGCAHKLGIKQETVDNAPTLDVVLDNFNRWITKIRRRKLVMVPYTSYIDPRNSYAVICTWSNSDLKTFLRRECNEKNLPYTNYLKQWVNAQKVAKDMFNDIPQALHAAAYYMGTPRMGEWHSALDDAETLAYLAWKLAKAGGNFGDLKTCN